MMTIDIAGLVPEIDRILSRGLRRGFGRETGQVCVEAAVCEAMGLPRGDDPGCVDPDVLSYEIHLNDGHWSSPEARARGMRDLAIAQLETKGFLKSGEFGRKMAEKTIRVLIPTMFREVFPSDPACQHAADRCEREGGEAAARTAVGAANAAVIETLNTAAERCKRTDATTWYSTVAKVAAWAADAATTPARTATAAWAADAANVAMTSASVRDAACASTGVPDDRYLLLSARLALDTLKELNAPGVAYLKAGREWLTP